MSNQPPSEPQALGNVTISTTVWDSMRDRARAADQEIVELRKELRRAIETADVTGTITKLTALTRTTFEVVRFAVGNLPPETIRNWPSSALRGIADALPLLPDRTVDDDAFANELRSFAEEIDAIERQRRTRPLKRKDSIG